ncbi:4-hydroxyphenylpyruvate dioxygenase family protein [Microbacterium aureliae]
MRTGYRGPVSLEVFNDTFRQIDVRRTAVHARRSLRWLEDAVAREREHEAPADYARLPGSGGVSGFDFVEIKVEDTSGIEALLEAAGFTPRGKHRTKPVTLWTAGEARVVLNQQQVREHAPHIAAIGLTVPSTSGLTARARQLGTPPAHRRTYAGEQQLEGAIAPDGTEIYWSPAGSRTEPEWTAEFEHGSAPGTSRILAVDHVSLGQPWQAEDEAVLFFSAMLELTAASSAEVASPHGLVASRVMRSADGAVRIPLNVSPPILEDDATAMPQHVAFSCDDIVALARSARERGLTPLPIPQNYYEDLTARFDLDDGFVGMLRDLDLVFDRDEDGEYLHFYTATVGNLFCEFVERRGRYDGYGVANAPVRLTAQAGAAAGADIVRP